MIAAPLPVVVFVNEQKIFGGMNDFQEDGVHYKIVHRKMDNGTEEDFLDCKPDISSSLKRLSKANAFITLYIFPLEK